jgi:hypothetical protein
MGLMKQLIILSIDNTWSLTARADWVASGASMSGEEYRAIKTALSDDARRAHLQGPERARDERYVRYYEQWLAEKSPTMVRGASESASLKVSDNAFARNLEVGEIMDGERFVGVVIGPDMDQAIDAIVQESGPLLQLFDTGD